MVNPAGRRLVVLGAGGRRRAIVMRSELEELFAR
jgi:hypothetical protein